MLIAEDALKSADIADKAIADGAALGPLHGIPFSIKDSLDTAGVLTQRGSKLFAGNIPDRRMQPWSHDSKQQEAFRSFVPNSGTMRGKATMFSASQMILEYSLRRRVVAVVRGDDIA